MAKSYLTPEELQIGNKWLKTVFFPCVKQGNAEYVSGWQKGDVRQSCKRIYQFIVERKIDAQGDLTIDFDTLGSAEYYNNSAFEYKDTYKIKSATFVKGFSPSII